MAPAGLHGLGFRRHSVRSLIHQMLFNSFSFAIFFAIVLSGYWLLKRWVRGQNILLLVASYVFYGWWDWRFLSLLALSTFVDYWVAGKIQGLALGGSDTDKVIRKRWLTLSIVTNIGVLAFFKYFNFFIESARALLMAVGFEPNPIYLEIILPVGISFYTFQTLGFTIDVYRRQAVPPRHFSTFALYVAFFPQLVAGPIERATALLPQFEAPRRFDRIQFVDGVHLILWGLFKKVYVADNLAQVVNATFANPSASGFEVMIAVYAFAFQIYGDFSGYSDIARGCGKCMGFDLMHNFRYPYVSINPSDFWRRWHISLSTWLRDYLYIPLGGNRGTSLATYRNLFITMLLGGLWHGATWLFVIWGAYQGVLLIVHRLFTEWRERVGGFGWLSRISPVAVRAASMVVMFQFICVGWLIFRGESVGQITSMLQRLFTWHGASDFSVAAPLFVFAVPMLGVEALLGGARREALHHIEWIPAVVKSVIFGLLAYLLLFYGASSQSFIYFQF